MTEELTDEEKKARRAEINRQNAQKSTGPKTPTGKAKVRLNGLRTGARSSVIDMSALESLVLLPREDPETYKAVFADYMDKLQPRDQVEIGVCQRIADTQWRLMRTTRHERTFNEECMIKASQNGPPRRLGGSTSRSRRPQRFLHRRGKQNAQRVPTRGSSRAAFPKCQLPRANHAPPAGPQAKIAAHPEQKKRRTLPGPLSARTNE